MINIKINSMVYIPNSVGVNSLKRIKNSLTFENPNRRTSKNKFGSKEQFVHLFTHNNGCLIVPRGAVKSVVEILKDENVLYSITSEVCKNKKDFSIDNKYFSMLRDYQLECVNLMLSKVQGMIQIPCGGGKTFIGCIAATASKQNTIILVHTEDLQLQWMETFNKIKSPLKIRLIGGKGKQNFSTLNNEVAICTVQTLDANINKIDTLMSSAGTIILDEAHHAPAATFQRVLQKSNSRYRWGLTATPNRPDGLGFILPIIFGETIFKMKTFTLFKKGYLMNPVIVPIRTGVSFVSDKKEFSMVEAVNKVTFNEERLKQIVRLTFWLKRYKRKVLILLPRVKACSDLMGLLAEVSIKSETLTSESKDRKKIIDEFNNGKLSIIIATQVADEGLDLPSVDTLIMASAGKGSGRAVQRVGRVMRISEGKNKPIVFDLVDEGIFKKHFINRSIAYYSEIGVQTKEMVSIDEAIKTYLKEKK